MSLPPEMLQRRYGAIERAYSERRWPEVESLSQGLLAELEPNPADPLQLRLVLLLGHTRLYGLADPSGARHYYDSVLENCEEPTLRDIAQQGLAQCGPAAEQQPFSSEAAVPWLAGSDPSAAGARTTSVTTLDASPWLGERTDAGQGSGPPAPEPEAQSEREPEPKVPSATPAPPASAPSQDSNPVVTPLPPQGAALEALPELASEIVDEPEQIAVAQADPLLRQVVELEELTSPRGEHTAGDEAPRELSSDQLNDLSRGLLRIRLP
jgi:hypothetical protein